MKRLAKLSTVLLIAFGMLMLADTFRDAEYIHSGANGKGVRENGDLVIDSSSKQILFNERGSAALTVPFASVTHLVYERASKPRYAAGLLLAWPLLFTKSKQHFLTVQYNENGTGKYAVFRLSKGNYREVLAAVEAATGQKVERQEER